MKKRARHRLWMIILCVVLLVGCLAAPASAAGSINNVDAFESLEGDEKYVGSQYRDNYNLDIEKTGLLDAGAAIINSLANILFKVVSVLGSLVVNVFYRAMDFDAGLLFLDQIDSIQGALKSSIFDSFFVLALCGSFWVLSKKMMRRDLSGMMVEMGKVILIVVLSFFVVTNSAAALSGATQITKSISTAALKDINSQDSNTSDYAATASGLIWKSLVHDPWISLQFGGTTPTQEEVDAFLTTTPGTEEREELVKTYQEAHKDEDSSVFAKGLGAGRIGFLVVYIIPFIIKAALYMLMAALQLGFQLMAVFYVLLAPVILLLSLLPAFGIDIITGWLKKILETQLMVLMLTFLVGLVLKLDNLLYSLSGQYGWLVVIVLETLVSVVVVVNYKSILSGISNVNRAIRQPASVKYKMQQAGDVTRMSAQGMTVLGSGARNISSKARTAMSVWQNRERLEYSEEDYRRDPPPREGDDSADTSGEKRSTRKTTRKKTSTITDTSGGGSDGVIQQVERPSTEGQENRNEKDNVNRPEVPIRAIRAQTASETNITPVQRPMADLGGTVGGQVPMKTIQAGDVSPRPVERPTVTPGGQERPQAARKAPGGAVDTPKPVERPTVAAGDQERAPEARRAPGGAVDTPKPVERPTVAAGGQKRAPEVRRAPGGAIDTPKPVERPTVTAGGQERGSEVRRAPGGAVDTPKPVERPTVTAGGPGRATEGIKTTGESVDTPKPVERPTVAAGGQERAPEVRRAPGGAVDTPKPVERPTVAPGGPGRATEGIKTTGESVDTPKPVERPTVAAEGQERAPEVRRTPDGAIDTPKPVERPQEVRRVPGGAIDTPKPVERPQEVRRAPGGAVDTTRPVKRPPEVIKVAGGAVDTPKPVDRPAASQVATQADKENSSI